MKRPLFNTFVFIFLISFLSISTDSIAVDAIENEFIVRINASSNISSLDLGSNSIDAESKNNQIIHLIEQAGIGVKDSFIEKVPAYQAQSTDEEDSFSETIADEIGFVFLLKSDSLESLEAGLRSSGLDIDEIEPNYSISSSSIAPDLTSYSYSIHSNQENNYGLINLLEAWGISTGSSGVRIAVLDTGIDSSHVGLSAFIDTELGRNFTSIGGLRNFSDIEGHGTHVAGIIASSGRTSGIMKQASIVPLKVLDNSGNGNTFDLEKAILYSIEIDVDIINMSLGGPNKSSSLERTIQLAHDRGIIMVASAGNSGKGELYYPAKFEPVISVGSVNNSGLKSSFSNYGFGLDIMAPGENIYSSKPRNQYGFESGTSSSAPHVAGIIGLAKSVNPDIDLDHIREIFRENSNFSSTLGFGVIDARVFLESLSSTRPRLEDALLFGSSTTWDSMKEWTISFNLDLSPDTINSDSIYILDSSGLLFPVNISLDGSRIVLRPLREYSPFESYSIYMSGDIKSNSGSRLNSNLRFDFRLK